MLYVTPVGKRRYDQERAALLRRRFYRAKPGTVALLTRQTLRRLLRPSSHGSFLQREWRESVSLAPFHALFPRLTRWSKRNFRARVEAVLPLYIPVFSDDSSWFTEFTTELAAQEATFLRLKNGTHLAQQLIVLMAESVVTAMYPASIRDAAGEASRRLVSLFAPTLAKRLHSWMDFIEVIDAFLARSNEAPFFGVEFLLSDSS